MLGAPPKLLMPEHQYSARQRVTSKATDLIIKNGRIKIPGLAIDELLCMSVTKGGRAGTTEGRGNQAVC